MIHEEEKEVEEEGTRMVRRLTRKDFDKNNAKKAAYTHNTPRRSLLFMKRDVQVQ